MLHNFDVSLALSYKVRIDGGAVSEFSSLAIQSYYVSSLGPSLCSELHLLFEPFELVHRCDFNIDLGIVLMVSMVTHD